MTASDSLAAVAPNVRSSKATDNKLFDQEDVKTSLGDGPLRFAHQERTVKEQIDSLSPEERACVDALKQRWEKKDRGHVFSDEMYLRFARCSPGATKFNEEAAWKVMKKFNPRYLTLTAEKLEQQMLTKTLFVVPSLKSKDGHDVFYMRPSRYFPSKTSTEEIIDNLAYCMNVMVEKEKACSEGIAFMANMTDWSFKNFSVSYCHQFMMMLQGRVPVRVRLFLIVDPPGWFDSIWKIMKTMLSKDFQKKVHMIPASELSKHLEKDCEENLPDDIQCGKASTDDIVSDFVAFRKYMESKK
eukprot:CAMPEP_0183292292 /NCGR_PEP_ID=MMETSP0160_2-20130417/1398_1 /TAXON_ID=2839 ORGANISM="Odontella Sinensis, Strain Grunow 1884" /NCGR_SAMPLE_ID=MMETSP0160_2 /ASSEMBLY_ACC=CAM_ASM_000250 /LENGTH=298 /DNA_ID=CAMNT_0025453219 /DNA_START=10 /DNA_END=906 /DNA_ORIENTATION=+